MFEQMVFVFFGQINKGLNQSQVRAKDICLKHLRWMCQFEEG